MVPSVPAVSALGRSKFLLLPSARHPGDVAVRMDLTHSALINGLSPVLPTTLKHPLVKMCLKSSLQFSSLAGSFIGVGTAAQLL